MLVRLGGLGRLLVAVMLTVAALLAPPAGAQEAAADEERLRELIATIEDPERREELLARLRLLLEAEPPPAEPEPQPLALPPSPEGAVAWLVQELSAQTERINQTVRAVVDSFRQVPFFALWLENQLADPGTRALWLEVALRLAVVLGIAAGGFVLAALALKGTRARVRAGDPGTFAARVVRDLGWLLLELVPVVVFAALAYATLALLDPRLLTRFIAVALINAVIIVRMSVAVLRVLFAPGAPGLRLVPMSDEAAAFAFRWFRRLIGIGVYGYFALVAAGLLGLPWTLHGFLLQLLLFTVAVLAVVMILRARTGVAATIAYLDDPSWGEAVRYVPWTAIAGIWHVLAILWVAVFYLVWSLGPERGPLFMVGASVLTLVIIAVAWALIVLLDRYWPLPEPPAREEEDEEPELPGMPPPPPRPRLPTLRGVLRAAIGVLAVLAILEVWNFGTLGWIATEAGQVVAGKLLSIGLVVLIAFVIGKLAHLAIERYVSAADAEGNVLRTSRQRTLMTIARNAIFVFVTVVASLMVLSELGLDITPLLAGAGIVGLAIGFGAQKAVQDIITGLFILLGDTVRVGDVIEVAGRAGIVESVSIRAVTLRDYGGNVHTIPYSAIDSVTNMTKDFSYYVFDIGVAYREDADQVMAVMREVGAQLQRDPEFRRLILEPLEIAGVNAFADSAVVIRARIKTVPIRQWQVGREYNRRLKKRFDQLGIEIPFPHRTLYFGVDKDGKAPPAAVQILQAQAEATALEPEAPAEQPQEPAPARARARRG